MPFGPNIHRPAVVAIALLALLGCGRAASPATADDAVGSGLAAFAALDADRDGRLGRIEAGLPGFAFDGLDRDGDGALSFIEWNAGRGDADTAFRLQIQRETQRDTAGEPHRNGSTVRGSN